MTSIFFKLLARAPRIFSCPRCHGRRDVGVGMARSPRRYIPVNDSSAPCRSRSAGDP